MRMTIKHFLFLLAGAGFLFSCGCHSVGKKLALDKNMKNPLLLEIKLPEEVNLIFIESKALQASRDITKKTNKFKRSFSKEFKDQSNWKHYLSIDRPIPFTITNISSRPIYFLWRCETITIRLKNKASGESVVCKRKKDEEIVFYSIGGAFRPGYFLTSLKPGECIIGCVNPANYKGFPDHDITTWDLSIEIEFLSYHPYYDVDMFSGKLKSNVKQVVIHPPDH